MVFLKNGMFPLLLPGQIHVWTLDLRSAGTRWLKKADVLSHDEARRASAFTRPADRRRFVAARTCLRLLLGFYADADPRTLKFGYGPHGKPRLVGRKGSKRLHFNLSHAGHHALLAFSVGWPVGIDLERRVRKVQAQRLARRFFSPKESTALHALGARERVPEFLRLWVRKEALLKAAGLGVTSLRRCADFKPAGRRRWTGRFRGVSWTIADLKAPYGFVAAIAARAGFLRIRQFRFRPGIVRQP